MPSWAVARTVTEPEDPKEMSPEVLMTELAVGTLQVTDWAAFAGDTVAVIWAVSPTATSVFEAFKEMPLTALEDIVRVSSPYMPEPSAAVALITAVPVDSTPLVLSMFPASISPFLNGPEQDMVTDQVTL